MSSPLSNTQRAPCDITTLAALTADLAITRPDSPLQKFNAGENVDNYLKHLTAILTGQTVPTLYSSSTTLQMQEDILLLFSLWINNHYESDLFTLIQILPYYANRLATVDEMDVDQTICSHHLINSLNQSEESVALAIACRVNDFTTHTPKEAPQLNNEWALIRNLLIKVANQSLDHPSAMLAKSLAAWQSLTTARPHQLVSLIRPFASIALEWIAPAPPENRFKLLAEQTCLLYDYLLDNSLDGQYMLEVLFFIGKTDPTSPCNHRYSSSLWIEELGNYERGLFLKTVNTPSFPTSDKNWFFECFLRETATPTSIELAALICDHPSPQNVEIMLNTLANTNGPLFKQRDALQAILNMKWIDFKETYNSTSDEDARFLIDNFIRLAKQYELPVLEVKERCEEKINTLIRQRGLSARKKLHRHKDSLYIQHLRKIGAQHLEKENEPAPTKK